MIRLPLHRFLNCVYAWAVARIDPERREEWDMMLEAPLEGQAIRVSPAVAEAEGEAFMDLFTQVKGAPDGD